jgi:hypothetical protein
MLQYVNALLCTLSCHCSYVPQKTQKAENSEKPKKNAHLIIAWSKASALPLG